MTTNKSPFLVTEHFISPQTCEQLAPCMELAVPQMNDDKVLSYKTTSIEFQDDIEEMLFETIDESKVIEQVEQHYGVTVRDFGQFEYQWYPMDFVGDSVPYSDAYEYHNSKWYRVKDRDFTSILFLNEFNDQSPLDPRYEVFGGKFQMINWNFSFQPQRGTLITFPSCPRFMQAVSPVTIGESHVIKFFIRTTEPYVIDVADFPGSPSTWFSDL